MKEEIITTFIQDLDEFLLDNEKCSQEARESIIEYAYKYCNEGLKNE